MDFGKVVNPETVDFTLPEDAPQTKMILEKYREDKPFEVSVGLGKWNETDLKGFYPAKTKNFLEYYSSQFNSIEFNATFHAMPEVDKIIKWREGAKKGFKFFPKITGIITHSKRLVDVKELLETYCRAIVNFEDRLGMVFMQFPDDFTPKDLDLLKAALENFPKGIPLAVEVRNKDWFSDKKNLEALATFLEEKKMANVIVDTAGRRDMLHMRLTSPEAFVRFTGANHPTDFKRLDDWVVKIKKWREAGLQKLYFFIHQNVEESSPLLAIYFIKKLNKELGLDLPVPKYPDDLQQRLF